uniref:Uncharacterized protein n=1 Tax=Oryza sativa subsp. indica TaxID=39946 RepID=I4DI85_ORYSI|nr:unknown protein [Oryza sativa Indica Group]
MAKRQLRAKNGANRFLRNRELGTSPRT